METATITTTPIELIGGRHDGTQINVFFEKDRFKYEGIFYSDTNHLTEEGRVAYRCSSKEGHLKQSFFESKLDEENS